MLIKTFFSSLFLLVAVSFHISAQELDSQLDDGVMRILAIGNSFSEDAVENNLYELAKSKGQKMVIANLYIGGAAISLHVKNVTEDNKAYSYRKIGLNGLREVIDKISISKALNDEHWDYISFQQASPLSGLYDSYITDLPKLVDYVKNNMKDNATQFILHETWAYQHDSNHKGFKNYGHSQSVMFTSIVETTQKVMNWGNFSLLIPSGTAIQNARTTFIGDNFTRDGYHLNLKYGRFVAACTWYEVLFKDNVMNNSYLPIEMSYLESKIAKEAAHQAVLNPYKVTNLTNYSILLR